MIFNFMVVGITAVGIDSLGYRFVSRQPNCSGRFLGLYYTAWTVLNALIVSNCAKEKESTLMSLQVPIVYFLYTKTAGGSLKIVERFFEENQNILIFTTDPAAKTNKRPASNEQNEQEEIKRDSAWRNGMEARGQTNRRLL